MIFKKNYQLRMKKVLAESVGLSLMVIEANIEVRHGGHGSWRKESRTIQSFKKKRKSTESHDVFGLWTNKIFFRVQAHHFHDLAHRRRWWLLHQPKTWMKTVNSNDYVRYVALCSSWCWQNAPKWLETCCLGPRWTCLSDTNFFCFDLDLNDYIHYIAGY